ncbi:MAG: GTP-binding protein [Tissierellia bacterium]|nr:GTP-binding protein [Tissierellia bacterium]
MLDNYHSNNHDIKRTVNVIGGFLGSGKTTLINYILSNIIDKKFDVLVREYGSVAIDDKLIKLKKENIHVFADVASHDDDIQIMLYHYLDKLYDKTRKDPFDYLLLESSGLDTPEALVHLFFIGNMQTNYKLGSYIALVDAEYGNLNLDEFKVALYQIAFADVIIINKVDLADKEEIHNLKKRLHSINGMAEIYHAQYGQVNVEEILHVELYEQLKDLENKSEEDEEMVQDNIKTLLLTENRPLDMEKMNEWIKNLYVTKGMKILRSKGFLYFKDEDYRYEFQAVRKTYHSKADKKWEDNEERKSVIVLIGDNEVLDAKELQESFSSCAFK